MTAPSTADFVISLYDNGGDIPGTVIQTYSVTADVSPSGFGTAGDQPVLIFWADPLVPTVDLTGGTTYWVSIYEDDLDTSGTWAWANSTGSGIAAFTGSSWISLTSSPNLAFSPSMATPQTAMPEPGALALLGFGLAALGYARRRKAA